MPSDLRSNFGRRSSFTRRAFLGGLGVAVIPLLAACAGNGANSNATPSAAAGAATTPAPTTAAATSPTTAATTAATTAGTPTAAATAATAAGSPTAAATTAATTGAGTPTAQATAGAATTPAAGAATTPLAAGTPMSHIGGTVSVLATWGSDEQDSFMAMVKPYEDQTGVQVQYTGTRDLNAVLTTRVQAGNPPELAGLPGPGPMAQFARAGKLIDLSSVLDMTQINSQYGPSWIQLATVDNKLVSIFIKASLKSQIWYDPQNFQKAGYQVPKTWDDAMALSQKIAGTGTTPWSIGLEAGAASGWPGTDWIEDFVLHGAGPELYDSWWQGKTKWTSPEITKAWQDWGTIVGDPKMVYGGKQYMLATNFGNAADPLFTSPPKAYLHHEASFITTFIQKDNPNVKPVTDYNFFMFPDMNTKYTGAVEGAGDLFGMFKKTDQSAALIKWLATPQAQEIWVKRGGALSPNKQVPMSAYPDQLSQNAAKVLTSANIVRFDASDLMPDQMNTAFYKAVLDFVQDTGRLNSILQSLDNTQSQSYKTS